jgi:hypothetical protein
LDLSKLVVGTAANLRRTSLVDPMICRLGRPVMFKVEQGLL